jgi:hypothetical protein
MVYQPTCFLLELHGIKMSGSSNDVVPTSNAVDESHNRNESMNESMNTGKVVSKTKHTTKKTVKDHTFNSKSSYYNGNQYNRKDIG